MLPASNTDDSIEHFSPILIQTSMKGAPTDGNNVKPEVRDSIGLRDCTKDDVDIAEDRKGWWVPWRVQPRFTVYNSVEGKYVQVWKIAKVYESGK